MPLDSSHDRLVVPDIRKPRVSGNGYTYPFKPYVWRSADRSKSALRLVAKRLAGLIDPVLNDGDSA